MPEELQKVRVQLLDSETGTVLQDVNPLTSGDAVTLSDGRTLQQRIDEGGFDYDDTSIREELAGKAAAVHTHTKAEITDMPTKVSEFENDAKYQTEAQLTAGLATKAEKVHQHVVADITDFPVNVSHFTNDVKYQTEEQVAATVAALVDQAPETLDTLKELSTALGDDPNFATTVSNQIGLKADKTAVYTKEEIDSKLTDASNVATETKNGLMAAVDKVKLNGIEEGANKTIVDAELSDTSTNPVQNKVVKAVLDTKSNKVHQHVVADITDFPTALPANGGNADTVGGFTVGTNVPADAKFTDTVYTHPETHPATMIVQDATHRFTNDIDKAKLDALDVTYGATPETAQRVKLFFKTV